LKIDVGKLSFIKLATQYGSNKIVPHCRYIAACYKKARSGPEIDLEGEDFVIAVFLVVCKALHIKLPTGRGIRYKYGTNKISVKYIPTYFLDLKRRY
jgi:hypothetical protein